MKTQDFISNNIGTKSLSKKWCSSVFQDVDGNFYSYGYHYPLLIEVNGLWLLNTAGYSISTAKHIHWARSAAHENGISPIEVKINMQELHPTSAKSLLASLDLEADELKAAIKKGRDGSGAQEMRYGQLAYVQECKARMLANDLAAAPY